MKFLPVIPERWPDLERLFEVSRWTQALLVHGFPTDVGCLSARRFDRQEASSVGDGWG